MDTMSLSDESLQDIIDSNRREIDQITRKVRRLRMELDSGVRRSSSLTDKEGINPLSFEKRRLIDFPRFEDAMQGAELDASISLEEMKLLDITCGSDDGCCVSVDSWRGRCEDDGSFTQDLRDHSSYTPLWEDYQSETLQSTCAVPALCTPERIKHSMAIMASSPGLSDLAYSTSGSNSSQVSMCMADVWDQIVGEQEEDRTPVSLKERLYARDDHHSMDSARTSLEKSTQTDISLADCLEDKDTEFLISRPSKRQLKGRRRSADFMGSPCKYKSGTSEMGATNSSMSSNFLGTPEGGGRGSEQGSFSVLPKRQQEQRALYRGCNTSADSTSHERASVSAIYDTRRADVSPQYQDRLSYGHSYLSGGRQESSFRNDFSITSMLSEAKSLGISNAKARWDYVQVMLASDTAARKCPKHRRSTYPLSRYEQEERGAFDSIVRDSQRRPPLRSLNTSEFAHNNNVSSTRESLHCFGMEPGQGRGMPAGKDMHRFQPWPEEKENQMPMPHSAFV